MIFRFKILISLLLFGSLSLANVDQGFEAFEAGDYQQAMESWRAIKADDPANSKAWFALGLMHEKGWGVTAELNKAKQYYLIASDHDFPSALFKLGALSAKQQNYQQAIEYWNRAAELKTPEAAYNLAHIYRQGLGVQVDEKEATFWYKKAANFALEKQKSLIYPEDAEDIVQFIELDELFPAQQETIKLAQDNSGSSTEQGLLDVENIVSTANAQENVAQTSTNNVCSAG